MATTVQSGYTEWLCDTNDETTLDSFIFRKTWDTYCIVCMYIYVMNFLYMIFTYMICTAIRVVGGDTHQTPKKKEGVYVDHNYRRRSPIKRPRESINFSNSESKDPAPPTKGSKKQFHSDRQCGECTIWLQLGSPEHLRDKHKIHNEARHPSHKFVEWQKWLLKGGENIDLRFDSCLCPSCEADCRQRRKDKPRYYYQLHPEKKEIKHCVICHQQNPTSNTECQCITTKNWGQKSWLGSIKWNLFERFFTENDSEPFTLSTFHHKDICIYIYFSTNSMHFSTISMHFFSI